MKIITDTKSMNLLIILLVLLILHVSLFKHSLRICQLNPLNPRAFCEKGVSWTFW